MMILHFFAGIWSWWVVWRVAIEQFFTVKRGAIHGDEKLYTQMIKSFILNTLTVDKLFALSCPVGFGLGWDFVVLSADIGWGGSWVGLFSLCWCRWVGHYLGWVGDIRGVRVDKPFRFSRSPLVACLCLFNWSLGIYIFLPPFPYHRRLTGGHLRRLLCCLSGIDLYLGVIRKDQLGGSSFWCNPTCLPTPMLETKVGLRNRLFADIYLVGLGWNEGWDRWWTMSKGWPYDRASYTEGVIGILGWVMHIIMLLLDLCLCVAYITEAVKWLKQIGRNGRNKFLHGLTVWCRGIDVITVGVCIAAWHIKLVLQYQIWPYVWVAKRYGYIRDMQVKQRCTGKLGTCNWGRICWVGTSVLCELYLLGCKCSQTIFWCRSHYQPRIKQLFVVVYSRGNYVISGWGKYFQDVFMGRSGLIMVWYVIRGDCKCSEMLNGALRLLFSQLGLMGHSPGWFRCGNIYWLAAWDSCMVNSAGSGVTVRDLSYGGILDLVVWPRVMLQLFVTANGLASACNSLLNLCTWPKRFMLGLGYTMLLSILTTRNWLKAQKMMLCKIWAVLTWAYCWTRNLMLAHNHQKWACNLRCIMLWAMPPLTTSCSTIKMKAHSVGLRVMLHGLKAWAWITVWAWVGESWVHSMLGWVSYSKIYKDEVWLLCDCGPSLKYGQPPSMCVFVNIRCGFVNPCNTRFHCIPSIGRMISYFWSPKLVLGDVPGGMPP
ncbi:hypothetical protein Hanom_Chr15g01337281 [Helianthus anomalus]